MVDEMYSSGLVSQSFWEEMNNRFSMNRKLGVMMQREKDFGMRLMREDL